MNDISSTTPPKRRPLHTGRPDRCDRVALVLQGGGALGAYQAGVYQAMHEANIMPDWVAGVSIGAINAAIIAGNPPHRRIAQLQAFWDLITERKIWAYTPDGDVFRTQSKLVPRRSMTTLVDSPQMPAPSPLVLQWVSDQVWTTSPKRLEASAVTVYWLPEATSVVPSGLVILTEPGLASPGGENDHAIVVACGLNGSTATGFALVTTGGDGETTSTVTERVAFSRELLRTSRT